MVALQEDRRVFGSAQSDLSGCLLNDRGEEHSLLHLTGMGGGLWGHDAHAINRTSVGDREESAVDDDTRRDTNDCHHTRGGEGGREEVASPGQHRADGAVQEPGRSKGFSFMAIRRRAICVGCLVGPHDHHSPVRNQNGNRVVESLAGGECENPEFLPGWGLWIVIEDVCRRERGGANM
jgi:hypothetical protein